MFNTIHNRKVYEQVIEQIQHNIITGKLKKGDKLPSERDLSELMNISRTSIREAIRVLEAMGVVESIQGEGNFICANGEKSLLQPLSMMFKLNNGNSTDIFELRKLLEVESSKLASIRATDMDCRELTTIIKKMETETYGEGRNDILVELDKDFHKKIASLSKNFLIECLFNTSSFLFEKFIEEARFEIIKKDSANKLLFTQHKLICESIVNNNQKLATEKMTEHMNYVEEILIELT